MGDCLREKLRVLARENGMEAVEASRRTCTPSLGPEEEGETLLPSGRVAGSSALGKSLRWKKHSERRLRI